MLNLSSVKKYDYIGACTFYLGAIVVVLVCQAIAGVVASMLSGVNPDIADDGIFNSAFMIVIQLANAGLIGAFCMKTRRRPGCDILVSAETEKLDLRDIFIPVLLAAALLIGMYLPTLWYGYFTTYALHIPPEAGNIDLSTPSAVVLIVVASVFLAPLCEETIYRGVLYNGVREEKPVVKSVLLSALAFMLMHMSPVQVVFQFALGVTCAFIMHRTGRLFPCILLHATANALALVMQLTPLGEVLFSCELWLTDNVAAAVFITIGLFAAAGAVIFVGIKFALGKKAEKAAEEPTTEQEIRMNATRKDGTFRFYIGIAICAVMFVINLVVMAVGS